jgi:hypothetical protein
MEGARRRVSFLGHLKLRWQQIKQRLVISPALPNDCLELELPGAWEPPDSSSPTPDGEGKETRFGLPYGNQTKETEDGTGQDKTWF